jgi:hypothetical protein
VSGNYWAIFSTRETSNRLFARVNGNGTTTEVDLGALPTGFHTYKVQPVTAGFEFHLDGQLYATINASFQTSQSLKAALSDFSGQPSQLLQADWVNFNNYSTTQTARFTSSAYDANITAIWDAVSWTASVPSGTTLQVEISVSNDNSTWSTWTQVTNGSSITNVSGRYIRYRVTMTTTNATITPILQDISLIYS